MKIGLVTLILCLGLFSCGACAQSVVSLDGSESPFEIVYLSSELTEVRAFQLVLTCDSGISITDAVAIEPYQIFSSKESNSDGVFRISGFTTNSPGLNQRTAFAKLFTKGNGSISVKVQVLSDFNRNPIVTDNQDMDYLLGKKEPINDSVTVPSVGIVTAVPTPSAVSTVSPTMVPVSNTATPSVSETVLPMSSQATSESPSQTSPVSSPLQMLVLGMGLVVSIILFKNKEL